MNKPLIVGITGGIGGGKSTLAEVLREKGYPVYDTDAEAKKLQDTNPLIREKLMELFGKDIYTPQGLDRKKLGAIVFNHPEQLARLNKAVHPTVRKHLHQWTESHPTVAYIFIESAIMLETGLSEFMDVIVVVTAPEEVRIDRVMKRDNITKEEAKSRIARQMPEEKKIAAADIVLNSVGKSVLTDNLHKLLTDLEEIRLNR